MSVGLTSHRFSDQTRHAKTGIAYEMSFGARDRKLLGAALHKHRDDAPSWRSFGHRLRVEILNALSGIPHLTGINIRGAAIRWLVLATIYPCAVSCVGTQCDVNCGPRLCHFVIFPMHIPECRLTHSHQSCPRKVTVKPRQSTRRVLALMLFLALGGSGRAEALPAAAKQILPLYSDASAGKRAEIFGDGLRSGMNHLANGVIQTPPPGTYHAWMICAGLALLAQLLTIAGLIAQWRRKMAAEKHGLDRAEHYRAKWEAALERQSQIDEGWELLTELHQRAGHMTEGQICERALQIAMRMTKSETGYLHLLSDSASGQLPPSDAATVTDTFNHSLPDNIYYFPLDAGRRWADASKSRRPVIQNEGNNGQNSGAESQLNMVHHMSAPVFDGDRARLIMGVGDKDSDYLAPDLRQLQLIANEAHQIVMRRRASHDSDVRWRFIINLSPAMICLTDTSKRGTWFNQAWLDFTGKSLEQELGRGWTESIHADEREACLANYTHHFDARRPFTMEYRLRQHDGKYRWVLNSNQPQFDENGAFEGYVGTCLDITERRQAALERELMQTIFMRSLDMMCIAGADGYFKKVNPALAKVLGYSAEELLERPFIEFVVSEDRLTTQKQLKRQLQSGVMLAFENSYLCKDGTIKLLAWHGFADQDQQLIYATARDISLQRAGEEQLNKLWLAVEQTSHSIVITDLDGRIEYVNRAFSDISGYPAGEVIGQNPNLLFSGLTPVATYAQMWSTLRQGDIWQGEFYNRSKSGELYIESARISPVRQPDGRITHYLAIKEDITEKKRTADAIHESKVLLQRVIDSTPDWIHVKDRQHCFMLVNQSFASAFNQAPEDMVGRKDTDFMPLELCIGVPDKGLQGLHNDDDRVFNGQPIHDPCDKIVFENGEIRVFDTFKGPLRDSSQKIHGILCYRRDVTERFNIEQEQQGLEMRLRQAQKMELIGHLTGGIAHDFNNILAAILGYAELIQMSADIKPPLYQYLQEILQAGIRAKELVAQLLTFSHRNEVVTEAIMVMPIVQEVAKLLRSTMPTSISIKAEMAMGLPEVLISPVQLHQILMNLGINARDAIVGAGTIEIKVAPVCLDECKNCASCHHDFGGDYLMISVRDTGSGIPTQNLLNIFDPFFTTKQVGRGSGLGLSVLHGIVHSANGHIAVLTALGKETEFRIYLPAQSQEATHAARDVRPDIVSVQVRGSVMVVDDEASIVRFITALLENLGCKVTGLTSAADALRLFQDDPYCVDLVITDQTMPEITGAELARAMLARRPELPIIMSTGYSNAINEDTARKIGIRRFLVKPVPAKVLADIVAEYLAELPARQP